MKNIKHFLDKVFSKKSELIQNSKEKEEGELNYREIEDLRRPAEDLLLQLKEKIDRGEYNLIIGDDASGRIPTRIFYNTLKAIYEKKKYESPKVIFFAGSGRFNTKSHSWIREEKTKMIKAYLKHFLKNNAIGAEKIKALVISEVIDTGNSLKPLADALHQEKIDFDIAAFSGPYVKEHVRRLEEYLGCKIFEPLSEETKDGIYGKLRLHGVRKETHELFAHPLRDSFWTKIFRRDSSKSIKNSVKKAREDVNKLSEYLVEWYSKNQ
jgi:hypothetical protein